MRQTFDGGLRVADELQAQRLDHNDLTSYLRAAVGDAFDAVDAVDADRRRSDAGGGAPRLLSALQDTPSSHFAVFDYLESVHETALPAPLDAAAGATVALSSTVGRRHGGDLVVATVVRSSSQFLFQCSTRSPTNDRTPLEPLIGFSLVLPSFTGFSLVSLGFTSHHGVLLVFIGFLKVLPSFT